MISSRKAMLFVLGVALMVGGCRRHYRLPVERGADLTQRISLEAGRRAIQLAGYDARRAEPVCYWDPCDERSPLVARNDLDADRGYVLWRLTDREDGARRHLFVGLQMEADHVDCTVSEGH
jgi:hypothetical protein